MAKDGDTRIVREVLNVLRMDNLRRHRSARRIVRDAYTKEPCVYCGGPNQTADHVLPQALGGGHLLGNLVPACKKCNGRKGADLPVVFFRKYPKAARRFVQRAIYADADHRAAALAVAATLIDS